MIRCTGFLNDLASPKGLLMMCSCPKIASSSCSARVLTYISGLELLRKGSGCAWPQEALLVQMENKWQMENQNRRLLAGDSVKSLNMPPK